MINTNLDSTNENYNLLMFRKMIETICFIEESRLLNNVDYEINDINSCVDVMNAMGMKTKQGKEITRSNLENYILRVKKLLGDNYSSEYFEVDSYYHNEKEVKRIKAHNNIKSGDKRSYEKNSDNDEFDFDDDDDNVLTTKEKEYFDKLIGIN